MLLVSPPWFCCVSQGSHTHTHALGRNKAVSSPSSLPTPKCLMIKSQLNTGTKTQALLGFLNFSSSGNPGLHSFTLPPRTALTQSLLLCARRAPGPAFSGALDLKLLGREKPNVMSQA